jgi:hypothetical protein
VLQVRQVLVDLLVERVAALLDFGVEVAACLGNLAQPAGWSR